jgi:hypothetical protein
MQARSLAALVVAIGVVTVGCGSSKSAGTAATGCASSGSVAVGMSATYRYVVDIGPLEQMYDQAAAAGRPAGSGEVMLGGSMTDANGPNAEHLEVHICNLSNSQVVVGATPTITLTDTTAGTPPMTVDVAEMQGIGETQADYHYGNNVVAPAGHAFVVNVTLNGEHVSLPFTRAS